MHFIRINFSSAQSSTMVWAPHKEHHMNSHHNPWEQMNLKLPHEWFLVAL